MKNFSKEMVDPGDVDVVNVKLNDLTGQVTALTQQAKQHNLELKISFCVSVCAIVGLLVVLCCVI